MAIGLAIPPLRLIFYAADHAPQDPSDVGSQPLTVSLPAGTKCTGGNTGNLCLVSFTTAGRFGNCVVVQQGANGTATGTGTATTQAAAAASGTAAATQGGGNGGVEGLADKAKAVLDTLHLRAYVSS